MNKPHGLVLIIAWSVVLLAVLALFVFLLLGGRFGFSFFHFDFGFSGDRSSFITVQEQSLDPDEVESLSVNWISGRVRFAVGGDTVRVMQRGPSDLPEKYRARIDSRNGALTVRDGRGGFHLFSFGTLATDLEITLPEKVYRSIEVTTTSADFLTAPLRAGSLQLKSTSGEITAAGSFDTVQASSTSGDLLLDGLAAAGSLTLSTTSGEITGADMSSDSLQVSSVSGDVRLSGRFSGPVRLKTTSGEVGLDTAEAPSSLNAHSVSGDIQLRLPSDSGFTLSFHSTSGKIRSDFETSGGGDTFLHGDGSHSYSVSTTSGDVRLEKYS
ncbi:MAG: DUF4097 domain-containing protein [Clostridiales bacterium]|nr:DUF4097 domain-containing protein [Clostridiales bacterium]